MRRPHNGPLAAQHLRLRCGVGSRTRRQAGFAPNPYRRCLPLPAATTAHGTLLSLLAPALLPGALTQPCSPAASSRPAPRCRRWCAACCSTGRLLGPLQRGPPTPPWSSRLPSGGAFPPAACRGMRVHTCVRVWRLLLFARYGCPRRRIPQECAAGCVPRARRSDPTSMPRNPKALAMPLPPAAPLLLLPAARKVAAVAGGGGAPCVCRQLGVAPLPPAAHPHPLAVEAQQVVARGRQEQHLPMGCGEQRTM
jgi:hypothetical protein